ncbi:hypothetical protein BC351_07765 [Paenibacillus ferrarius]|uniref:Uncharacterized protein n=1 Tax=Paenibacillus ferrarius TaxID=1469647 RepID=A0A1V4HD65_9BACL|nr:hypothetical protein BC351_07765 [Paenibacillus ferrarius]
MTIFGQEYFLSRRDREERLVEVQLLQTRQMTNQAQLRNDLEIDRWDQMVALHGGSSVRTANPDMYG